MIDTKKTASLQSAFVAHRSVVIRSARTERGKIYDRAKAYLVTSI